MFTLSDFGSFYIGGRNIKIQGEALKKTQRNKDFFATIDPNGDYIIEQTYVQYFLPVDPKEIIVLIHGGGHTGAVWETTPDGRKGWLHLLLKKQIGVYIIDTIERGRSGWCNISGIWNGEPELRSAQRSWSAFRIGDDKYFAEKNPYPHQQFPVENFDTLVKYNVPRWNCNAEKSSYAVSLLIKNIGRCSIIAHSQGSDIAMRCLGLIPELIHSIALIEPAGFPDIKFNCSLRDINLITIYGDHIELSSLWRNLHAKSIEYTKDLLNHGIIAEHIDLPKIGINGNSHMLMMDKNNARVLDLTLKMMNSCYSKSKI